MQESIDWQAAYVRLAQTREALEAGGERSPDEIRRILRERALTLAKPLAEIRTPEEMFDLLVFSLGGERYGIEMAHVLEVISLRELTPVPCTPPVVLGVVNHRGRILPVLDLRRLFGLSRQGVIEGGRIVAVEAGRMTCGIFAEGVAGAIQVAAHEVAHPPTVTATGGRQAFIRGVTREMVAVLDLEVLARDQRIVVNDEVGG